MPATSDTETTIQAALAKVQASGLNSCSHPNLSICKAAEQHGLSHQTLNTHYNGHQTCQESHSHQQAVPPTQEEVLKE
ncbi:hypothetical protein D9756_010981 [Leucocoprinus leucothites]|uniref:HTH psq-type domain-containing protein n=1 Tax=Leucocoprinus leucothites TaxID=201217 RepID=A0A8H5CQU3_9AGAR|nr:hypothetical protein D9756_010981 [Leucoagaricus leucothites]